MQNPFRKWIFLWLLLAATVLQGRSGQSLSAFLNEIGATQVRMLQGESIYDTIMEVMVPQPLDHHHPEGANFLQRIYISNIDPSLPVVLSLEGYDARYYYTTEIAARLQCNQIMVEHRYFGESTPDSVDWNYLDTWQAASDDHRIVQEFKKFYGGKWIATGISKGGQTVMYHSFYYPDDVDVRVPYVAPLVYSTEDPRIYEFLDTVGTGMERRKVKRFQKMALKREDQLIPAFRTFSEERGYTYDIAGGTGKAFEYCVLEYSFAYWQWGYASLSDIPGKYTDPGKVIEHMNRVAQFDYFTDGFIREYRPFFYQAMTEIGYYGYDLKEFDRYLRYVDHPDFSFTLPAGENAVFNPKVSEDLEKYLQRDAKRFIFIYGANDTWSATAVSCTDTCTARIFFKAGGNHRTRISNMPPEQQEEVYATLDRFLDNNLLP
jgi:hypothetical protein